MQGEYKAPGRCATHAGTESMASSPQHRAPTADEKPRREERGCDVHAFDDGVLQLVYQRQIWERTLRFWQTIVTDALRSRWTLRVDVQQIELTDGFNIQTRELPVPLKFLLNLFGLNADFVAELGRDPQSTGADNEAIHGGGSSK